MLDDLFAIDAAARAEKMDHAARHALRQQKAPALLHEICEQILAAQKAALQKRYGKGLQLFRFPE